MTKMFIEGRHMKPSSRSRFKKFCLNAIFVAYAIGSMTP